MGEPKLDPGQKNERPKITDEDIEQLMKAFEEEDKKKPAGNSEAVAELSASLETLGDQLAEEQETKKAMPDPEMFRVQEFKKLLESYVDLAVEDEIEYLLGHRQTIDGADMISVVIDHALEKAAVTKDASKEVIERFMKDPALRFGVKQRLMAATEIKMQDPAFGNDQEKVSKLEKALDALEQAS